MQRQRIPWAREAFRRASRPGRRTARSIGLAVLAATLVATTLAPVSASAPDRGVAGAGKNAAKASGRITKSFGDADSIAIPGGDVSEAGPAAPYPSRLSVSGFKNAKIVDVNLTLRNYSHTFTPDVDVLLVAPGGRNAIVMSDVGIFEEPSPAANIKLKLDDEASNSLPIDAPPTSGTFRPRDAFGQSDTLLDFPEPAPEPSGDVKLSTFDGIDPNGKWKLFVLDDTGSDSGAFANGWKLTIVAKSKKRR